MRKVLWLIPPLLGAGFYAAGAAFAERGISSRVQASQASMASAAKPARGGGEEALQELVQSVAEGLKDEEAKIADCSPAQLRELILRLRKKQQELGIDRVIAREYPEGYLHEASARLGELEKGEALAWMLEHAPDQRDSVIAGWGEIDPPGAFDAIAASTMVDPCNWSTLIAILQRLDDRSPALLKEAIDRMPWRLFEERANYLAVDLPEGASARPWAESGISDILDRELIDTGPLLNRWMQESPREALAQWQAGDGLAGGGPGWIMARMLGSGSSKSDPVRNQAAIDELPPAVQERIAVLLTEYVRREESIFEWRKWYPRLIRLNEEEEESLAKEREQEEEARQRREAEEKEQNDDGNEEEGGE